MYGYKNLEEGPIDEIDAAVFCGDLFLNRQNIEDFRKQMARWERELVSNEAILDSTEEEGPDWEIEAEDYRLGGYEQDDDENDEEFVRRIKDEIGE
jgi:hypothetical protein